LLLCFSVFASASEDKRKNSFIIEANNEAVTAIKPELSPIVEQEKNFSFNWNEYSTISDNKKKISANEKFLANIDDASQLSLEDQTALGRLFYKLGAYYAQVSLEPDLAIAKLTMANAFLKDKEDKAWNYAHLAYAYEQKYALTKQSENNEKALYYANKIISELFPNTKNPVVAFAYSIKGILKIDANDYQEAQKYLQTALAIYETSPEQKGDQYARTKNQLAYTLLEQPGKDQQAITIFKELKRYWSAKGNVSQDPFAAHNLISLGQAYIKMGKTKAACSELKGAIAIYKNVYGNHSPLLVHPYQLLAEAYKSLGKVHEASVFEQKAKSVDKA
jgi:tetratricopeptide (TPR) repeat protein